MQIDYRYMHLARRLNEKFSPAVVDRHWLKAQKALNNRIKAAR